MVQNGKKRLKKIKKMETKNSKVGGMGPKALLNTNKCQRALAGVNGGSTSQWDPTGVIG